MCTGSGSSVCDDGNPCTDDIYDSVSGGCAYADNAATCDDGNLCTADDTCAGGICGPGVLLECGDDGGGGSCGTCEWGTACESGKCVPAVGGFGWPCELNADCVSGLCVDGPGGEQVCTQTCTSECPEGWTCQLGGGGPDVVFLCVWEAQPALRTEPSETLDFGFVPFGGEKTLEFAICNDGGAPLEVFAVGLDGSTAFRLELSGQEILPSPEAFELPMVLVVGVSEPCAISPATFAPSMPDGEEWAELTLWSNDPVWSDGHVVVLHGRNTSPGEAALSVLPPAVAFGDVLGGSHAEQEVLLVSVGSLPAQVTGFVFTLLPMAVSNEGTLSLTVAGATYGLDDPPSTTISIDLPSPIEIAPADSTVMVVGFDPQDAGLVGGTLSVVIEGDAVAAEVAISGNCAPNCSGKECGDDACGGTCGTCPIGGQVCEEGGCTCVAPTPYFHSTEAGCVQCLNDFHCGEGFYCDDADHACEKIAPQLTVLVTLGSATGAVTQARVFAFAQSEGAPACADLAPPASIPPAEVASAPAPLGESVAFETLPGVEEGVTIGYTVVVLGMDATGKDVAWGCDEASVAGGTSKTVVIALVDLPAPLLNIAGSYDAHNHFGYSDWLAGAPEAWAALAAARDLVLDPASVLLRSYCRPGEGAAQTACESFFVDPSSPGELTTSGMIVHGLLLANLTGFTDASTTWETMLSTGGDVFGGLLAATWNAGAEFKLSKLTDDYTFQGESNWTAVEVAWAPSLDCLLGTESSCQWKIMSWSSTIGADVLPSSWVATLAPDGALSVDPFTLSLKPGALLLTVLEKVVLPLLAGNGTDGYPAIDSLAKLASVLHGGSKDCLLMGTCCGGFAADVIAGGGGGLEETVLEEACQQAIESLEDYVVGGLSAFDATAELTAQTAEPCAVHDGNGDGVADALGSKDTPCQWLVTVDIGDESYPVPGTLTASRK